MGCQNARLGNMEFEYISRNSTVQTRVPLAAAWLAIRRISHAPGQGENAHHRPSAENDDVILITGPRIFPIFDALIQTPHRPFTLHSPRSTCLRPLEECRARAATPDHDLSPQRYHSAEATQRLSQLRRSCNADCQNNRYPTKSETLR